MNRQDLLQWLFQLIVDHTERTEASERVVSRLKVGDEGLDLITKHGRHFRILVSNPDSASETGQRDHATEARRDGFHLSRSEWETLVEACESMLQYLKSLAEREERDFGRRKEKGVGFPDPFS